MHSRLILSIKKAPSALIRVIGIAERRGFALSKLQVSDNADGKTQTLELELLSETRNHDSLIAQIGACYDVVSIARSKNSSASFNVMEVVA